MANNFKISSDSRSASAGGALPLVNGGKFEIWSGTIPANPQAADAGDGTKLIEFTLSSPAYTDAVNGVADLRGVPLTGTCVAGTASHFRVKDTGGKCHHQGSVATASADLVFPGGVVWADGGTVTVTGATYTQPE